MIYAPCAPIHVLIMLAIDCQEHWQTDSDNLDYMARFYDFDDTESAESPSTEASRDRAWEIYG